MLIDIPDLVACLQAGPPHTHTHTPSQLWKKPTTQTQEVLRPVYDPFLGPKTASSPSNSRLKSRRSGFGSST